MIIDGLSEKESFILVLCIIDKVKMRNVSSFFGNFDVTHINKIRKLP